MEALILGALTLLALWWFGRRRGALRGVASRRRQLAGGGRISPRLMRELDRLTRDHRASLRLIERIESNNPGRSRRWCIEKAIYDIQRDRRS